MNIEDQVHQIFSDLIRVSQSGTSITFENENFSMGRGPKQPTENGYTYDLTGSCGILGHGHPLTIKSHFKASLRGSVFPQRQEIEDFLKEALVFLTTLNPKLKSISLSHLTDRNFNGRFSSFFSEYTTQGLISGIFPFSLSFSEKEETEVGLTSISQDQLILAWDTLRFLREGNFYGNNGLIKVREEQLKAAFKSKPSFKNVNGLIVEFEKNLSNKNELLSLKNKLIFPLSFDEIMLEEILRLI